MRVGLRLFRRYQVAAASNIFLCFTILATSTSMASAICARLDCWYVVIGRDFLERREQPNLAKIEARHYTNEPLGANKLSPSPGENRGSSPLGSATPVLFTLIYQGFSP